MKSAALDNDSFDPFERHRRKRLPRWTGPAVLGLIVLGIVASYLLRSPAIGERDLTHEILNVVLPPPPPPPPPKVKPPEPTPPKRVPRVIEPKPQETPPPPTPAPPQPTQSAPLTARVGNGPTNFGLAVGNGSGLRIGGSSNNGFAAYGQFVTDGVQRAIASDPELAKGQFSIRLQLTISPEGQIVAVRFESSSGDSKLDNTLEHLLSSLTLPQRPPAGLPPVRIELNQRPSL